MLIILLFLLCLARHSRGSGKQDAPVVLSEHKAHLAVSRIDLLALPHCQVIQILMQGWVLKSWVLLFVTLRVDMLEECLHDLDQFMKGPVFEVIEVVCRRAKFHKLFRVVSSVNDLLAEVLLLGL